MKVLYFTDAHIKGATPSGRSDIYYIAILKKLVEIEQVILKDKIDFVVIGGDLFDIPNVSLRIYSLVAKLILRWKAKVFVIPGNHDVFGQSINSLEHTSLGALASSGVVTVVTEANSPICLGKRTEPNNILALNGQEYYADIDTGKNEDYNIDIVKQNAFNLLVVHGFAVTKAFHPDIPHTIINTIDTDADLILTGHYHPDRYDEATANGVKVLKPRGFGRVEATKHNIDHKPDYLILEIENNQLKSYEFREIQCAADGKDIFDAQYVANTNKKKHKATLTNFLNSIEQADLKSTLSTRDMLKTMATGINGVTQDHILQAIKLIGDSEKSVSDKELDGFIPQKKEINIIEIELENFQSHKHTVIKLDPTSLNAFIGASHSGKTAAIRALNWVFYNDPKGSEMINQSESKCSASVLFDNGIRLKRYRSKSSSGGYIIEDTVAGTTVEFNKFSSNIPVDVFNAHQMPKITIGKEKVSLNFGMQLDGPFMLSMTGSERATIIGNITGADVVDEAVGIASSKIVNTQRGIKTIEADIKALSEKISKYDILDVFKQEIDKIQTLMDYNELLGGRLKEIDQLINYVNINKSSIASIELKLASMPDVNGLSNLIAELEKADEKYDSILKLQMVLSSVASDIEICNQVLQKCSHSDEVKSLINTVAELQSKYFVIEHMASSYEQTTRDIANIDLSRLSNLEELSNLTQEIEKLNDAYVEIQKLTLLYNQVTNDLSQIKIPALFDGTERLDALFSTYQILSQKEDELKQINASIEKEGKFIKNKETDILDIMKQYREKLKALGQCPVCNSVLSEEKIDTIEL